MGKIALIFILLTSSVFPATLKISGTSLVQETDIYNTLPNDCYGGRDFFRVGSGFGGVRALIRFDVSGLPAGATVTAAVCSVWIHMHNDNGTVEMYELKKIFVEGNETTAGCTDGTTPTDWDDANAFNWDTFHADCANNAAVENNAQEAGGCVADSADRTSTLMDSEAVTAVDVYEDFDVDANYVQDAADGITTDVKLIFIGDGSVNTQFRSSEEGTNPPSLTITYTPAAAAKTIRNAHLRKVKL